MKSRRNKILNTLEGLNVPANENTTISINGETTMV